jgi:vacuolar-type H+-ATPase subunit E/Vma4
MSLESIINHILEEAGTKKQEIIQQAQKETERMIQEARLEADNLYQGIIIKAKADAERQKHQLLVQARLEQKKNLLKTKQEFIDNLFQELKSTLREGKIKKQEVYGDKIKEAAEDIDFYLEKSRHAYESEIAGILFG